MTGNLYGEFSEYNIIQFNLKFESDDNYTECLKTGNIEEEMEAKTVSKKYGNVVAKQRTKGTGNGTLKVTGHMNYQKYCDAFGMKDDSLKTGIMGYGKNSRHKEFSITTLVEDEDGDFKYKAYPRATITNNMSRKIENEGEEVAEIELEIAVMPDKYGFGMYEALASELDEDSAAAWMTEFDSDFAQAPTV